MKVFSVIGTKGTVIVFEAPSYKQAKRYKARLTRWHMADRGESFRWSTREERATRPSLCSV